MSRNVEIVQSIYAAWGAQDAPGILAHIHEDVDWEYVDGGVPWLTPGRGHAAVTRFLQAAGTELEFTKFAPSNFLVGGNSVGVVVDVDATVRKTGRLLREIDQVHLWQLDDAGKVVRFRHVANTAMQQAAWRG